MPNHVHAVIVIDGRDGVDLGRVVNSYKASVTKSAHRAGHDGPVWQRGYYEHIVRDEDDFARIAEYIDNNPAKWALDRYWRE